LPIGIGPIGDGGKAAPIRTRYEACVGGKILVRAHVDETRRIGQAYAAGKLRNGDFGW
jgi:hypothetical protein